MKTCVSTNVTLLVSALRKMSLQVADDRIAAKRVAPDKPAKSGGENDRKS